MWSIIRWRKRDNKPLYSFSIAAVNFYSILLSEQNDLERKIQTILCLKVVFKNIFPLLKIFCVPLPPAPCKQNQLAKCRLGTSSVTDPTESSGNELHVDRQIPLMSELCLKALLFFILLRLWDNRIWVLSFSLVFFFLFCFALFCWCVALGSFWTCLESYFVIRKLGLSVFVYLFIYVSFYCSCVHPRFSDLNFSGWNNQYSSIVSSECFVWEQEIWDP